MFTGIIATTATIVTRKPQGRDYIRLSFMAKEPGFFATCALGDSVSVSGACLTMIAIDGDTVSADVSHETLQLTTLGTLEPDDTVNLELACLPTTRLGGHIVTGHVDGIGTVTTILPTETGKSLVVKLPKGIRHLVAKKGSIAIEGASLTVNEVTEGACHLHLIPHTLKETTLSSLKEGSRVNVEADIAARYLERIATSLG